MRLLRVPDTMAGKSRDWAGAEIGTSSTVLKLRRAGFDLTREILYQRDRQAHEILFLQYLDDAYPVRQLAVVGDVNDYV